MSNEQEFEINCLLFVIKYPYLKKKSYNYSGQQNMQQPTISTITNTTIPTPSLPPNLQQDLIQVFTTLQSSLYILFLQYRPYVLQYQNYLKLTVLVVGMVLFYRLGGMTVTDRVEKEKESLKRLIERRNFVREKVPKQIAQVNSNTFKILVLCVLGAGAYAYAFYSGHQQQLKDLQTPIIMGAIFFVCYLIYINLSKLLLSRRLTSLPSLEQTIQLKLTGFGKSLGPKVISILRNHLCRETQLRFYNSKSLNECQKQDCKEIRALMKQKNDAIASLVEETVDFEWCSVCKKRLPFDQLLHFEAKSYHPLETDVEADEVKNKLGYLMDGLDRMRKWLTETSPCNCSKLYWTTSTKQIIEFKKTEKVIEAKTRQLQKKHHKNE